jgi:hypothetical protein
VALLHFTDDEGVEQSIHVGRDRTEIIIGRTKVCDLVTSNSTVSRRHASITFEDGNFVLRDLGSANGTYHHRQRVKEAVLKSGDAIFAGSLPLSFILEPSDGPAVAPAAAKAVPQPEQQDRGIGPLKEITADYTDSVVIPSAKAPAREPLDLKLPDYSVADVVQPDGIPDDLMTSDLTSDESLAMSDLERIIDAAEMERGELIVALDSAQERYYEASSRADDAEAVAIDLRTTIAELEDDRKSLAERLELLERENADRLMDFEALRQERETLGIEAAGLRTEIEDLRSRTSAVDQREHDAALQTIEDMKLANRGYLKKISRLLEERDKNQTGVSSIPVAAVELAEKINELASRAVTSIEVMDGLFRESQASSATVFAVAEIRTALADAVEAVAELKKGAVEMRRISKGGKAV